jgi:predicted transcriptional regulator
MVGGMTESTKAKVAMSAGVDPDIPGRLDAVAKRKGWSRAKVVREALGQYLQREDPDPSEGGSDAGTAPQRQRRAGR